MNPHTTHIGILNYTGALQSAVFGLAELFELANRICNQQKMDTLFEAKIVDSIDNDHSNYQVLIIPPSLTESTYLTSDQALQDWILSHHQVGSIICSACAGAFILASTGLLNAREATTPLGTCGAAVHRLPGG